MDVRFVAHGVPNFSKSFECTLHFLNSCITLTKFGCLRRSSCTCPMSHNFSLQQIKYACPVFDSFVLLVTAFIRLYGEALQILCH